MQVVHPLAPIFNKDSKVLILGTMPSPVSREWAFYYAHPQNRFWPVLAAIFEEGLPADNEGKKQLALRHGVAIWDVLQRCEIDGASDKSIKNAVSNDLAEVLSHASIQAIFTTGQTAFKLYEKLCLPQTRITATALPSTSPANARCSTEKLLEAYRMILPYLK